VLGAVHYPPVLIRVSLLCAHQTAARIRIIAEDMRTSIAIIDLTYSHVPRALQQSGADRLAGMLYGT
jgi:hypothetical protein